MHIWWFPNRPLFLGALYCHFLLVTRGGKCQKNFTRIVPVTIRECLWKRPFFIIVEMISSLTIQWKFHTVLNNHEEVIVNFIFSLVFFFWSAGKSTLIEKSCWHVFLSGIFVWPNNELHDQNVSLPCPSIH